MLLNDENLMDLTGYLLPANRFHNPTQCAYDKAMHVLDRTSASLLNSSHKVSAVWEMTRI